MLISGGKVIAIDKVLHDSTLTGNGRFEKLGVNTTYILTTAAAASAYQPKGDYVDSSTLRQYYKIADADAKFATIAGVYSKTDADARFQLKGDYATNDKVDALDTKLDAFKTEVVQTYQTITGAAITYATKTELSNQYTTITEETNDKIDNINNTIDDLRNDLDNHEADENVHINADVHAFLESISGINFDTFVNTSGLAELPTGRQYAILNVGNGIWNWVETQGGGVANISADEPVTATRVADGIKIGLVYSATRAINEANELFNAYTLIGARGMVLEDDSTTFTTRVQCVLPEVIFTGSNPTTADYSVYFMTMTADLLE